jgi:Holliday junction resolvasome RuvABC endonuclease subunit
LRVLALDIATSVGFAAGDGTRAATWYGTHRLTRGDDLGRLSHLFGLWLADQITTWEPELIAIERGFFRGPASYQLSGMIWDAHRIAYIRGVPRVEYPPLSIKKFITGTAKADKDAVIAAVNKRGFGNLGPRLSDHEADAIALLLLALDRAQQKEAA